MFARMECMGPFTFFFTVSCAEKRWTEVMASLLKLGAHQVTYEVGDNSEEQILIDGIPYEKFVSSKINNMTAFMKDKFIHITRLFDDRLKSFIKNILNSADVSSYSYRIEFQVDHLNFLILLELVKLIKISNFFQKRINYLHI